jgi:molecular chaperone GrpE (heat shock protein)
LVEAASGVSAVTVSASVAYDALVASTTSAVAQASVSASVAGFRLSYVAIAASVVLDELGFNKKVRDAVAVAEAKTFALSSLKTEIVVVSETTRSAVTKVLAHSVSVADVINIVKTTLRTVNDAVNVTTVTTKHIFKNLQHAVLPVDVVSQAVNKLLADAFALNDGTDVGDGSTYSFQKFVNNVTSVGDARFFAIAKTLTDQLGVADDVAIEAAKSLADAFSASSATFTSFSKALADTLTAADVAAVASTKTFSDTAGTADSAVRSTTKAVADSFGFTESGSVISQGYCDLTYFEADYVGEYRTFA